MGYQTPGRNNGGGGKGWGTKGRGKPQTGDRKTKGRKTSKVGTERGPERSNLTSLNSESSGEDDRDGIGADGARAVLFGEGFGSKVSVGFRTPNRPPHKHHKA